ncbi:MAG: hypothetical protein JJE04_26265 [Acidobacteriia bacterium]|nr:hypothetical protein [Terriglobia bacterium]
MRSALLLLALASLGQSQQLPTFERFRVARVNPGKPVTPYLRSEKDPIRREKIKEGAKAGTNFAGHFTIAEWECGATCRSMALIDTRNGTVHDGPFNTLGLLPGFLYEGKYRLEHLTATPLTYKIHSGLLIVRGCPENQEKDCASYFYEWAGTRFKLLATVPATTALKR